MRIDSVLRFLFVATATAAVSATLAAGVVRWIGTRRLHDVRGLQSEARYVRATTVYQGRLSGPAAKLLRDVRQSGRLAVVVVLRAKDAETCEDLGRQLRELRRAIGPERPLLIFAEPSNGLPIANFARSERLANVRIAEIALETVLAGNASPVTPLVLLVDEADSVVEGVAHPLRFPDARVRSFASELGKLQAR